MSERSAGQEGPTPDFIPGWFAPRPGNPDPAVREAVRIPEVGDHFPVTFLRDTETVRNPRRPQRGFTIGRVSEPGHELFDLAVPPGYWIVRDGDGALHNWRDEDFKAKYRRVDEPWTPPVDREAETVEATIVESPDPSQVGRTGRVPVEALVSGGERPAWAGEPPAEGTRRRLILDAIREHDGDSDEGQLELADAIESALLAATIAEEEEAEAAEVRASMERLDTTAQEDGAPHRRELHIVLDHGTPASLMHSGPKFVELEDERGRSLGGFESRWEGEVQRIVIPVPYPVGPVRKACRRGGTHSWPRNPSRDGTSCLKCGTTPEEASLEFRTDEWVQTVVMAAITAGQEHDAPFPADVVDAVLREFGVRPTLPRKWPTRGEAAETADDAPGGDDPAATIKFLEGEVERLLGGREEARSGESRYAEERDCAFALLRWLLPVTVAKRID